MNRSSEFYLNMIQAELDQAEDALADGYAGRARDLIQVVIADCKTWILELEGKKGSSG